MMAWKRTMCRIAFASLALLVALFLVRWVLEAGPGHLRGLPRALGHLGREQNPAAGKGRPVWDVEVSNCTADLSVMRHAWVLRSQARIRQFMLYRHCRYFPMLHNHPEKCAGDVYLLLAVKSTLPRLDRREAVRQTWGREREAAGGRGAIRTLFLLGSNLGKVALDPYNYLLDLEDGVYQDILQWDFLDSFFNLTLKEVNFLKWLEVFCPGVSFIFKGDDDVFVSPANLLEFLKERTPQDTFLVGEVLYGAIPIRIKRSKYYIPWALYNQTCYPPYVAGGGYLMTREMAHRLHLVSQTLELYPIDDVFLGMCLQLLFVNPIPHEGFKSFGISYDSKSYLNKDPCIYRSMMMVHKMQPEEMLNMWRLVHGHLNCSHILRFYDPDAQEEENPQGNMAHWVILYVLMYLVLIWIQK
ncbi:UDP-GlcNAc:betaGal beta-1,3-N-acetylglucosaminyltransferase 7-like [Trichosurus vulpecula]|uniref:UDP-GlcNAc:betaGal beta-1,3-N-acetylglucosaminyltransferase 7-like n=1 Tax=Trichosurus vulpecula TaxID=9337 RepID=UPI00186B03FE|nr:UDP-GlcNAc:betaGal beta-1,3-N-acetylglucosaminyltransferase 7-like [Trichosurus vulpecula]